MRSKLEYASVVWCPNYNIYITSIEKIQRRFLKYLTYKVDHAYPPRGIPQEHLLSRFNCVLLSRRRFSASVLLLFKILNSIIDCPQLLSSIYFNVPAFRTRNSSIFYLKTPRTNLLKFSPMHSAISNFNTLGNNIDIFSSTISQVKAYCIL